MKRHLAIGIAMTAAFLGAGNRLASAQDASFGCKVLLCAAATNPSWSGIPYCVPVMQQLFRQLARGGGWPSCPEAGNSGGVVGYERYQACPAGFTAVTQSSGEGQGLTADPNGATCVDFSKPRQSCEGGDGGGCRVDYPTTSRAARDEPYYVDIGTAGAQQRFYFSLRGY